MSDTVTLVDYYYTTVPDKAGEGARILGLLRDAGVNLLAFSGFPEGRRSQLDFIPVDGPALLGTAKAAKVKLSRPKKVFLVSGDDRIGAIADVCGKLAAAKVNITAVDAVCAGAGRFGAILWVKPRDVKKAAAVLGVM
jgi:predicted amino acid-binding ACT domain protein